MRKRKNKKLVLGLTGSFASGKTTTAKILRSFGAKVIDADKIAHRCLTVNSPVYRKIAAVFGARVLKKNKQIDRAKLGKIVFSNFGLLLRLNDIVHPEVIRLISREIKASKAGIVVLDAPLLIEAGLRKIVDKLLVVAISQDKQIERAQSRAGLKKADILKRIKSQIPLSKKIRQADFVIDNSGTKEETKRQVKKVYEAMS